ncbi:MAG: MMPL family transporter [Chloroflexi bacterium]|nr:MMPL family transporter [Chloroflexota bacterium]
MDRFFTSLGRLAARRRRIVLVAWLVVLAFGLALAPRLGEVFEREFVTGNTGDSQAAADVVAAEFSQRSPYEQQLVITSESRTVDDPAYQEAAQSVMRAAEATGLISGVEGFFSTGDRSFVSQDGRTTYMILNLRSTNHSDGMSSSRRIIDAVAGAGKPTWMEAYVTGTEAVHADLTTASQESIATAESVGLPIALAILVLVFGGLMAAGLPLVMGLVSILVALALAFVGGQVMDLSVFLENIATMLGLGLGIDYSLFMLTRFRAERRAGRAPEDAVVETVRHAGKAVAFSGFTVAIGLLALLASDEPTVISIGIGGVLVALVAVAAALTLLPALLAVLGDRIEWPRWLSRLVARGHRGGFWASWAHAVMRRPVRFLVAGLAVVALLAWPTAGLETGSLGVGLLGRDAQSRLGSEVMAREFGPGVTSPVQIAIRSPSGIERPETVAAVGALSRAIEASPSFDRAVSITTVDPRLSLEQYQALYADDFASVPAELRPALGRLVNLDRGGDVTVVLGLLRDDPGSEAARDAIRELRGATIPSIPGLQDATVLVGGTTAIELDAVDALYARFPIVVGIILAATFLLLLILFRSILIPLKAVIMNLLSVGAAYGLLVLAFQRGYAERVLDFTSIGAINWITPVLLFAVLFGLSMDYEVFLLSRIRELHDRGHGNVDAVALGLERTGGVITGAALIMIVVFAAFTLSPILVIKELGFALAAAVLIDATIVRMVLVPATMRLLGDWNWRIPGWLGRLLPRVELEREVAGAGATPMASALGPAMADGGAVRFATAGGARGEDAPVGSDEALAGGAVAAAPAQPTEGPVGDPAKPARRPRLRLGIPAAALAGALVGWTAGRLVRRR